MSAVEKLQPAAVLHEFARVLAVAANGNYVIATSAGEYLAGRALSCLVEPLSGDEILLASQPDGRAYVLAVLSRPSNAAVTLGVDGDMTLRARQGKLSMVAEAGVQLVTGGAVEVAARDVAVRAVDAELSAQRMTVVGRYLHTEVERIKTFASSFDAVLERFTQRAKSVYRQVDESERLKVRHYEVKASETMHLHGRNAVVTARELVKMDGEQIHMG